MKLTTFLILFSLITVFAGNSYSQSKLLSLEMKNSTVKEVLRNIEEKSEFVFMYSEKIVDVNREVSVNIKNQKINDVLDELFAGTDVNYKVRDRFILLSTSEVFETDLMVQQQPAVSGTVTDESGQPLPGVTVVVKGTTQGTVSNADGEYAMTSIQEDATLVFSFVGMRTQEIEVGDRSTIDVTMVVDAIGIEEVVAVGYGTMRKRDLTGSVVSADIEAFREAPNTNITQSLQGTVAGLNVGVTNSQGASPSISIRGQNSLSGSNNPLIVLDDVIYRGSLSDINPDDVESIDVLKDASSTAIYGSEASNGVVIVTTKKGKSGGKPIFSYTGSYSIQNPVKMLTPLDREGYLQKIKNAKFKDAYLAPNYTEPNPDFDIRANLDDTYLLDGYNEGNNQNWIDLIIQNGIINDHSLSMQVRTEELSYYISAGFTDAAGYIDNDDYQRYSFRINVDNSFTDWFKIGLRSFISTSDYSGASPDLYRMYYNQPLIKAQDEDGKDILLPAGSVTHLYYKQIDDLDKRLNLYASFYTQIDVPWVKGLRYKLNFSPNYRTTRQYGFNESANTFSGSAWKNNSLVYNWALDNLITYDRSFNDMHMLNITIAAGREYREGESTYANSGEFAMMGLSYNRLEDGNIEKQRTSSGAWDENSLFYMGRVHYGFRGKYMVTATIRRDGFSGFGSANKFAVFPSAAFAWNFSEEEMIKNNLNWLDFGKLRISYGESGNRTLGRYSTLAKMSSGYNYVFGDGGSSAMSQTTSSLPNNNLKWETTTGLNLGLDFAIINQRINFTADYYNTNTKDILYTINIPSITGFTSVMTNIGKVHNSGIEFTLNTTNIKMNDFIWRSTLNFSRNRNEVVSVLGRDDDGDGIEDDLISSSLFIGKSIGAIYGYNYQGIYQIGDTDIPANKEAGLYRWKDISGPDGVPDGEVTPAYDRMILGYNKPSYRWSLQNKIEYKNFGLMIFLNSIQGGKDWYYGSNSVQYNHSGINVTKLNGVVEAADKYWTPSNPDAPFRQIWRADPISNSRYFQRSFVRLQDVSLSYNLPKSIVGKMNIQALKLYVSGKNLVTWTNWMGIDPESGDGLSPSSAGPGMSDAPVLKSYTLGLNLTF